MPEDHVKHPPGVVRDTIVAFLKANPEGAKLSEIQCAAERRLGPTAGSSIRSYLRLNTGRLFTRVERGCYRLAEPPGVYGAALPLYRENGKSNGDEPGFQYGKAVLYQADCLTWLRSQAENSFHAVVTDPPYGLVEYSEKEKEKLRKGKGGVWRIPPSFDGNQRSPLPRFTTLTEADKRELVYFFRLWGSLLYPCLVPGANLLVASNPLLSFLVANALVEAGFERRGEIIRLTMTMRGGDRPKAAHNEFPNVSVMPRSMWEPWLLFRKPPEGRIQDNLRKWGTGGLRRPSDEVPFGDVIKSSPTRKEERALAPHPSLKPQAFLRQIVRAVLPVGEGVVLDPFAGAASTLAAAEAVGYRSVGVELDSKYFNLACSALPKLASLPVDKSVVEARSLSC